MIIMIIIIIVVIIIIPIIRKFQSLTMSDSSPSDRAYCCTFSTAIAERSSATIIIKYRAGSVADGGAAVRPITITGHPETIVRYSGAPRSTAAALKQRVADACLRMITSYQAAIPSLLPLLDLLLCSQLMLQSRRSKTDRRCPASVETPTEVRCPSRSQWRKSDPFLPRNAYIKENEGKKEYLYSAICTTHSLKALRHRSPSFTCKLYHACLSFVSVHQMAPPIIEVADIQLQLTIYLSTPKGRKAKLAWLVDLQRTFTHISGHPSGQI